MKAALYNNYGPPEVIKIGNIEKPVIKEDEILIKVHATTVTSGDARMRDGSRNRLPFWPISKLAIGLFKPRKPMLGFEFSGEVESIGSDVDKFNIGDRVYGMHSGTYTEYIAKKEIGSVSLKPISATYEESAAVLFGGSTALYFLRKGNIKSGQKILIYGASGSVGVSAIQLAKHFGAEVTAVCSTSNFGLVRQLGADYLIDYKSEDFTKNGLKYDIIFDTLGKTKYSQCRNSLTSNGHYLLTVFGFYSLLQMLLTSLIGKKKIFCGVADVKLEYLSTIKELMENYDYKAVIDKYYSLDEIVEAHEFVDEGHKKGNVVIQVASNHE